MQENFRCGHIAIVGRPNVGKSSLLNQLIQQKISIISHKPQTTRQQIRGIITESDCQYIFIDTPGLHLSIKPAKTRAVLNQYLNANAMQSLAQAEVILMLCEAMRWTDGDGRVVEAISQSIQRQPAKVLLALNKIDRLADKQQLLPILQKTQQRFEAAKLEVDLIPISATKKYNLERLLGVIKGCLPESPAIYDQDTLTDKNERFLCAEIVREKCTRQLNQELPYAVLVSIEAFQKKEYGVVISASIIIQRKSQKKIVIGQGGATIGRIRKQAESDITRLLGCPTNLVLWVKVRKNWLDDEYLRQDL